MCISSMTDQLITEFPLLVSFLRFFAVFIVCSERFLLRSKQIIWYFARTELVIWFRCARIFDFKQRIEIFSETRSILAGSNDLLLIKIQSKKHVYKSRLLYYDNTNYIVSLINYSISKINRSICKIFSLILVEEFWGGWWLNEIQFSF